MTAPDRTTWTVAEDAYGDETLWYGDTAVLRRCDIPSIRLAGAQSYDVLWDVLTAVLAPDEATIERLAKEVVPYDRLSLTADRVTVRRILAALAGTSAQTRRTDGGETEAAS